MAAPGDLKVHLTYITLTYFGTMAGKRLGKVLTESSALFLCDMQEGFRKTIQYYPQILNVSARMLNAAQVLEMPIIVTEQYPKGKLGINFDNLTD